MSISVNMEIKDELVEIPVATTKFFKTYWELAIKECEIKLFREGACFGKEQLHEIVRELEHLSNWVENHLLGSGYGYVPGPGCLRQHPRHSHQSPEPQPHRGQG